MIAAHLRDADRADPRATDAAESRPARGNGSSGQESGRRRSPRPCDARRAFDEAVELADEQAERGVLLERSGELAFDSNEMELALERLEAARSVFEQEGQTHAAARATGRMSLALWNLGRSEEAAEHIERAFAVMVEDEHDEDFASVAAEAARIAWFTGQRDTALERVDLALDIAEAQNIPWILSEALNTKAMAMSNHPHEWRALLREALEIALEHDLLNSALRAYNNLMIALWSSGREDEADALSLEAFELARSRGNVTYTTWFAGTRIIVLYHEGAWDEAKALGDSFLADAPASQGNPALSRCILATIARDRGDPDLARAHLALVAPGVTSTTDRQQESLIDHREFVLAEMAGRLDDLLGIAERWIDVLLELGSDEAAAQVAGMTMDAAAGVEGKDAALSRLVGVDRRALDLAAHTRARG